MFLFPLTAIVKSSRNLLTSSKNNNMDLLILSDQLSFAVFLVFAVPLGMTHAQTHDIYVYIVCM